MVDKNYCPNCDAFLPSESHKPMCNRRYFEDDTLEKAVARVKTATGSAFLRSEKMREIESELDYAEARAAHLNRGEKVLLAMLHLGGTFRFVEKLYSQGAIDFTTRRYAGTLICELYEELRQDAYIYHFSRSEPDNAGCL